MSSPSGPAATIKSDPGFRKILPNCAASPTVETQPAGARVFVKDYVKPEQEWKLLGSTPLRGLNIPFIFYRWKVEKEGYETVFFVSVPCGWLGSGEVKVKGIPVFGIHKGKGSGDKITGLMDHRLDQKRPGFLYVEGHYHTPVFGKDLAGVFLSAQCIAPTIPFGAS